MSNNNRLLVRCGTARAWPSPWQRHRAGRRDRQGVILLVVLGVLVIFMLAVLMFVIAARQHKATALAYQSFDRYDDGFEALLERAALQVIRGSNNPHSVVGPHSLLEDMYGNNDWVSGTITSSPTVRWGGEAFTFTITSNALNPQNGYYNGRVITFLDGPARYASTRVLGYSFSPQTRVGTFLVLASGTALPQAGDSFLINSPPFNGFGFGLNTLTGKTDMGEQVANNVLKYALMPNAAAFVTTQQNLNTNPPTPAYVDPAGPGGADEDYDAPDYNNLALAGRVWNVNTNRWEVILPSFHRPDLINYWWNHPIQAVRNLARGNNTASLQFQRRYILRPLQGLQGAGSGVRTFDGGNPNLTGLVNTGDANSNGILDVQEGFYNWDVDNDGDGLPDSIWVDLGMPVQADSKGRLYKPLFAFYIDDLDDRLNINVHTTASHIPTTANGTSASGNQQISGPYAGGVNNSPAVVNPGAGYGPAEINLRTVLTQAELLEVLFGDRNNNSSTLQDAAGRYGELDLPADGAGKVRPFSRPGRTASETVRNAPDIVHNFPERNSDFDGDALWALDRAGIPRAFVSVGTLGGGDNLELGFNLGFGQRIMAGGFNDQDEVWHSYVFNPYHVRSLSRQDGNNRLVRVSIDEPFTLTELEPLLRPYDIDMSPTATATTAIPSRLVRMVPDLWQRENAFDLIRRSLLTTDSFDLPVFSAALTPELRQEFMTPSRLSTAAQPGGPREMSPNDSRQVPLSIGTLGDLIALKMDSEKRRLHLASGGTNANFDRTYQSVVNAALASLTDPHMASGLKFDINRPLGNGVDDDNDGILDEADELATSGGAPGEMLWWRTPGNPAPAGYAAFQNVRPDYNNDGTLDTTTVSGYAARQQYARYLYTLLMLVKDPAYVFPIDRGEFPANTPRAEQERVMRRLTAQRLAQWAINVVDFRDPDSIMSPFDFDYEPFTDEDNNGDPWDVNLQQAGDARSTRYWNRLWGLERPELLLSETLAFHDCRTEDTDQEQLDNMTNQQPIAGMAEYTMNNGGNDTDYDQKRRPQGSLFIELYYPWINTAVPAELRPRDGPRSGQNFVDLSRMTPDNSRPVWQLVVGANSDLSQNPDTHPLHLDWTDGNAERVVWLTSPRIQGRAWNPTGPSADTPKIYYSDLDPADSNPENANQIAAANYQEMFLIQPGQYTVVGPRVKTKIGRTGSGGSPTNPVTIRLLSNTANTPTAPARLVAFFNNTQLNSVVYPTQGTQIQVPKGIVINTRNPHDPNRPYRPLSVSEPPPGQPYYPTPTATTTDGDNENIVDAYQQSFDTPFDPAPMRAEGTRREFQTVYLQRLADPTRNHDPFDNPYITIDSAFVDLTVFNGEGTGTDPGAPNFGPVHFASRQRNGEQGFDEYNLWNRSTNEARDFGQRSGRDLVHSLGFLSGFTNGGSVPNNYFGTGGVYTSGNAGSIEYMGQPRGGVFPWLAWNDRPFASPGELLLVPMSSQGRLLHELFLRPQNSSNNSTHVNHYFDRSDDTSNTTFRPNRTAPHWHFLNFFFSSSVAAADSALFSPPNFQNINSGPVITIPSAAGNFHRLMELVRVPSRFNGTDRMLHPVATQTNNPITHHYHPPFNLVSEFRDPGLVNLNTVFDNGLVWRALVNDMPGALNHWRRVFLSRQGYGPYNNNASDLVPRVDPNSPTIIANPFRLSNNAYNVPIPALRNRPIGNARVVDDRTNPLPTSNPPGASRDFVEAGFLRPDLSYAPPSDPNDLNNDQLLKSRYASRPLISATTTLDADTNGPLGQNTAAYNNADRNPYFRYQPLAKLANNLTTRSNVYAIWVTVGYFEVTPISQGGGTPSRTTHPDSFSLGAELGSDTGEIVRHRAFFILDRSIPVAFQRGEDHNVQHAIRVKRIIE